MRLVILSLVLFANNRYSNTVARIVLIGLFVSLVRFGSTSKNGYRREPGVWCRSINFGRYAMFFGIDESLRSAGRPG